MLPKEYEKVPRHNWIVAHEVYVGLHQHRSSSNDTADVPGADWVAEGLKKLADAKAEAEAKGQTGVVQEAENDSGKVKEKEVEQGAESSVNEGNEEPATISSPSSLTGETHVVPPLSRRITRSMSLGLVPPALTISSVTRPSCPPDPGSPVDGSASNTSIESLRSSRRKRKIEDTDATAGIPNKKEKSDSQSW
jgi:hypothetical protein